MGNETSFGLGFSGNEMIGKFVAGNDFNYVQAHATSIAASGKYNISSCSSEVIASGRVQMKTIRQLTSSTVLSAMTAILTPSSRRSHLRSRTASGSTPAKAAES